MIYIHAYVCDQRPVRVHGVSFAYAHGLVRALIYGCVWCILLSLRGGAVFSAWPSCRFNFSLVLLQSTLEGARNVVEPVEASFVETAKQRRGVLADAANDALCYGTHVRGARRLDVHVASQAGSGIEGYSSIRYPRTKKRSASLCVAPTGGKEKLQSDALVQHHTLFSAALEYHPGSLDCRQQLPRV